MMDQKLVAMERWSFSVVHVRLVWTGKQSLVGHCDGVEMSALSSPKR